jgi:hypothetical protein
MRKSTFKNFLLCMGISLLMLSSCKDDSFLADPVPVPDQSFVEQFDTLASSFARGWRLINKSQPIGPVNWSQGGAFNAYSSNGTNTGFIWCDFNATSGDSISCPTAPLRRLGPGVISNWAVSPALTMQNGDKIIFYTMCEDATFIDRLQVRMNKLNTGMNVGSGSDPGDFNISLLDINPFLLGTGPSAYPDSWTRFVVTVSGLDGPTKGRIAFRYFLEEGGPGRKICGGPFADGSSVGIDSVAYQSISAKK